MHIRPLPPSEYEAAIALFREGIERDWPREAWGSGAHVRAELEALDPQYLGAFDGERLVGCIGHAPLMPVLSMDSDGIYVEDALERLGVNARTVAFVSALTVCASRVRRGIARLMLARVAQGAAYAGTTHLVGHTGRPTPVHPCLRALPLVLSAGFDELLHTQQLYYRHPGDLEKVWVIRKN